MFEWLEENKALIDPFKNEDFADDHIPDSNYFRILVDRLENSSHELNLQLIRHLATTAGLYPVMGDMSLKKFNDSLRAIINTSQNLTMGSTEHTIYTKTINYSIYCAEYAIEQTQSNGNQVLPAEYDAFQEMVQQLSHRPVP